MTTLNLQVNHGDDDAHEAETGWGFESGDTAESIIADVNNFDRWIAGFVFDSVTVPNAATINSAYLSLYGASATNDDLDSVVVGEDVDDADDFVTTADVASRTQTSASVAWTNSALSQVSFNQSPDIASVVQEIVDRGSWASGNSMGMLAKGDVAASKHWAQVSAYESASAEAAKLDIDYTAVAGLSISVSDSITTTESVGELLPWLLASRADAISLAEVVSLLQEFHISTADALVVAEAVILLLRHQVSVTDAIAIVETVLLALEHQVDVGDSINVAEVVTLLLRHQIDVSDALAIADDLTVLVARPDLYVSVDATNSDHLIRGVKIVG